MWKAGWDFME